MIKINNGIKKTSGFSSNKFILFVFIIVLCFSLFFISGCTPHSQGDSSHLRVGNVDYMTGTDGLSVSFVETIFPKEVYENEMFTVGFDIANKGAYDINEGIISVGVQKDYVDLPEKGFGWENTKTTKREDNNNYLTLEMKGKSNEFPQGDKDIVVINMKAKGLDSKQGFHKSTINLNTCYTYSSVTTQSVCIDSDPHNLLRRVKSCTIKPISLTSQGGPVAITKIETRMAIPDENTIKPEFTIYIQNKGKGLIVNPEKIKQACGIFNVSNPMNSSDFNRISIDAKLEGASLRCEPVPLRITSNRDYVRCSLENGLERKDLHSADYSSYLTINITYGYQFSVSKDFTLRSRFS